jgi:hypothetical protein
VADTQSETMAETKILRAAAFFLRNLSKRDLRGRCPWICRNSPSKVGMLCPKDNLHRV